MLKLNGIFPPIPTSFDMNENLALDKMKSNLETLSRFDLSGFLILGSNGESVMLSENEKIQVFESARVAIPKNKIMLAGTGGQSTKETISLSKSAAIAGADAILVLNPFYYKGLMTKEALVAHYFAVADASTIPVIIYNMPANSGLDMSAETIVDISTHPNIIGMKDSSGNVVKMGDVLGKVKSGFQLLAGSAGFLLPTLSIGAVGGILALSNIAPEQCLSIYQNFQAENYSLAREMQIELIAVNSAVTSRWGIPALKAAMDYIGLYGGSARKPILPLKDEIKSQLLDLLNANDIR